MIINNLLAHEHASGFPGSGDQIYLAQGVNQIMLEFITTIHATIAER